MQKVVVTRHVETLLWKNNFDSLTIFNKHIILFPLICFLSNGLNWLLYSSHVYWVLCKKGTRRDTVPRMHWGFNPNKKTFLYSMSIVKMDLVAMKLLSGKWTAYLIWCFINILHQEIGASLILLYLATDNWGKTYAFWT